MKIIDEVINLDYSVQPKYAYHVTRKNNLNSIYKNGLEPKVPIDYGIDGDEKGIYLFKSIDDTENALYNWFGERIKEWEDENDEQYDEIILKIDIDGLEDYLIDSVDCTVKIDPSRIIDTFEM